MTRAALPIVLERRASLEIEAIDSWWRTNRTAVPDAFLSELELPELGVPARSTRLEGVRRILLAKTRHHVYYRVAADSIQVLAVWHTSRGHSPGL